MSMRRWSIRPIYVCLAQAIRRFHTFNLNGALVRWKSPLAFVEVHISRSSPGEIFSAVGAWHLSCLSRLLTLVPQQVARSRKLTSVAIVFPALWFRPALYDFAAFTLAQVYPPRRDSWDLVYKTKANM